MENQNKELSDKVAQCGIGFTLSNNVMFQEEKEGIKYCTLLNKETASYCHRAEARKEFKFILCTLYVNDIPDTDDYLI